MGEHAEGVPGWLSLESKESTRLIDQVEVSPSLWDQYEGCGWPLPPPSVRYDIESVLYVEPPRTVRAANDPDTRRPNFQQLFDDFYARALEALRALTEPDDFVFAFDCWSTGYLFWPHHAVGGQPWPLRVPGPEACWSLYAPPDYSWGFFHGWERTEIFGQPLLDAFASSKPELLSKVVAVDGVELPRQPLTDLEQRRLARKLERDRAENRLSLMFFQTGFNYGLCPKGPWTPELKRLDAEFKRTGEASDLARLITKIELVLDEQGIDHTPCVPLDGEDAS